MPTPPPNYYFKNVAFIIQNFELFSRTNSMSNPSQKKKRKRKKKSSELKPG